MEMLFARGRDRLCVKPKGVYVTFDQRHDDAALALVFNVEPGCIVVNDALLWAVRFDKAV